ncbi:DUF5615 family PIN-like protein [Nitrosomonas marina]|uniref:Predicted nuclease, contains PIN domain, potential toxin-antitoxin system component n=1 Tax=Nitrosomonas marina TaxID=917 RepID=A0A1H8HAR8_9PROT|nr:DUF5615 family PIN-like protein [Nitrosomonas marina]SEN53190.1 Predicted nuclease, contains PIN domain, potential toxin-antitoxin system component [Nitrosomonas marina]
MKLLIDMNLSPRWVEALVIHGIEATHWASIGAYNASDSEIMAYAKANDYIVLTHDLDFSAILAATHGEKPSVVQIRADDVSPDVIGKQVIGALQQMTSDLADGALLTIDTNRTRVRLLPLRPKPLEDK